MKVSRVAVALTQLTIACTDFPNEPVTTPAVDQAEGWPLEMLVEDLDTLAITVMGPENQIVTGLQVTWQSSNPDVVQVDEFPPTDTTREASLTSQLLAVVHARARGTAEVVAAVEGGRAFDSVMYAATITVKERWIAISAGTDHTCGISVGLDAFCWGSGANGTLGNGRPLDARAPSRVLNLAGPKFVSISAGDHNTCAITVQQVAYCWGFGSLGRLGNGTQSDQFTPVPVSLGRTWQMVSAGETSCAVATPSQAFCWGSNSALQLGTPIPESSLDVCGAIRCSFSPLAVRAASGDTLSFSSVDVATFHTCGLSSASGTNAQAFCWGRSNRVPFVLDTIFLLGDSTFESRTPIPVAAPLGEVESLAFKSLNSGTQHTCGVTITASRVYCWGNNDQGQLGVGSLTLHAKPEAVALDLAMDSVSAGGSHTCALSQNDAAFCWGDDDYGQLGDSSPPGASQRVPVQVAGGHVFKALTSGEHHTCGITNDGVAYCWGSNASGQLGTAASLRTCVVSGAASSCALMPVRVDEPSD